MCGDPGGGGGGATGRGGMHGFEGNDAAVGVGGGIGGNVGHDAIFQGATGHNTVNPETLGGNVAAMGSDADFSGINSEISRAMDTSLQGDFRGINTDVEAALLGETNSAAVQNDFEAINTEIANAMLAAQQAEPSQAFETFLSVAGKVIGTAGSLVFGRAFDALVEGLQVLGLSAESAAAAINGLNSGASASDVASSIGPGDMGGPENFPDQDPAGDDSDTSLFEGGSTGGNMTNDPTTYEFWDSFVDEWMDAKDKMLEDDAFRKSRVEPAIGKYQETLSDLSNQARTGTGTYSPVRFGMGDFRTSFVPKSGFLKAEHLKNYGKETLNSELALTDVMQPNRGSLDYLNQLKSLGIWEYQMKQQKDLTEKDYANRYDMKSWEPDDKGTWLDAIKDFVQVGDTVGDAINRYWP